MRDACRRTAAGRQRRWRWTRNARAAFYTLVAGGLVADAAITTLGLPGSHAYWRRQRTRIYVTLCAALPRACWRLLARGFFHAGCALPALPRAARSATRLCILPLAPLIYYVQHVAIHYCCAYNVFLRGAAILPTPRCDADTVLAATCSALAPAATRSGKRERRTRDVRARCAPRARQNNARRHRHHLQPCGHNASTGGTYAATADSAATNVA